MFYVFARFLSWIILHVCCGYRVEGRAHEPAHGPFIVAANHISYLDPPAVGAAFRRRLRFIAKDELFVLPVLGRMIRWLRAIPITLSQPAAVNRAVLKAAAHALQQGDVLGMFPEGGRQATGRVEPAKLGIAFIALHAGVPIVPVAVRGTDTALPHGARWLRRGPITVRIGAPIPVDRAMAGEGREAYERLAQHVTAAITQLYEKQCVEDVA